MSPNASCAELLGRMGGPTFIQGAFGLQLQSKYWGGNGWCIGFLHSHPERVLASPICQERFASLFEIHGPWMLPRWFLGQVKTVLVLSWLQHVCPNWGHVWPGFGVGWMQFMMQLIPITICFLPAPRTKANAGWHWDWAGTLSSHWAPPFPEGEGTQGKGQGWAAPWLDVFGNRWVA